MADAYLCLGANLGDRQQQLLTAMTLLAERAGDISAHSAFHESPPWGYESPFAFLNVVVHLVTSLSPHDLLAVTQQIECELGRTAKSHDRQYTNRLIDIDILMYDELILQTPDLILPHPLMHKRLFVLQPLVEIAPALLHPISGNTITELLTHSLGVASFATSR